MTSVEAALIGAITKEIADVLDVCQAELRKIEDAIGNWYEEELVAESFPIIELQRLDMIYQVQVDLAKITEFTSGALTSGERIDVDTVTGIANSATLDDMRSRFAKAGGDKLTAKDCVGDKSVAEGGSAELF